MLQEVGFLCVEHSAEARLASKPALPVCPALSSAETHRHGQRRETVESAECIVVEHRWLELLHSIRAQG